MGRNVWRKWRGNFDVAQPPARFWRHEPHCIAECLEREPRRYLRAAGVGAVGEARGGGAYARGQDTRAGRDRGARRDDVIGRGQCSAIAGRVALREHTGVD